MAQHNIGVAYDSGTCLRADDKKAANWYRLAAKQGHASSQNNLAIAYEKGRGVKKSKVLAYAWWTLAIKNGHKNATLYQFKLSSKMTSAELKEASRLAENCFRSNYRNCD